MELNLYEDWTKMDIHVKTDLDSTIVEWKDINGFPEDENDNVLYNSPETLYDYLVSNMGRE